VRPFQGGKRVPEATNVAIALQIFAFVCARLCAALARNRTALAAGNLFLRKQLALFQVGAVENLRIFDLNVHAQPMCKRSRRGQQ
jgi:hypothetical protein